MMGDELIVKTDCANHNTLSKSVRTKLQLSDFSPEDSLKDNLLDRLSNDLTPFTEKLDEQLNKSDKDESQKEKDRLIGRYVNGTYLVNALIHKGELSGVYRASCGDRTVVLKILHLDCTDNLEFKEKFLRQMQAIACIQTKKVVKVLDYGTDFLPFDRYDCELPFIATELCDFPTLAEYLQTNKYDVAGAIALILGVIKSLQSLYAGAYLRSESGAIIHPVKLWHHNLKPSNIFLGDFFIQLSDFGSYQLLFLPERGDWRYLAPEDWQGTQYSRDERRDVYGCGLILYEILSGNPYQVSDNSDADEWQRAIATDPIPNFANNLEIPRAIELLVLRCLEKDPQHRYSNLKQLQGALEEIAQIPQRHITKTKRSLFNPFYLLPLGGTALGATLIYLNSNSPSMFQSMFQPTQSNLISSTRPPTPEKNLEKKSEENLGESLEENPRKTSEPKSEKIPRKSTDNLSEKLSEKPNVRGKSAVVKSLEPNIDSRPKSVKFPSSTNRLPKIEPQPKTSTPDLFDPAKPQIVPQVNSQTSVAKSAAPIAVQPKNPSLSPSASKDLAIPVAIPVARRVEPIPPPSAEFFSKPLTQPKTRLIPPPVVNMVNFQDRAVSKQLQLSINVSSDVTNFSEILQRGGELATQTIDREFALYPQRQDLQVSVVGDRNGMEVPLLLAKVNRSEWQKDANIGRWANFITKSEALLVSAPASKLPRR